MGQSQWTDQLPVHRTATVVRSAMVDGKVTVDRTPMVNGAATWMGQSQWLGQLQRQPLRKLRLFFCPLMRDPWTRTSGQSREAWQAGQLGS